VKLPVVDTSLPLLELFSPAANPLSNGLMELTLFACWLLTIVHVRKALRRGDQRPLFAWVSILVYAVTLEIITYHFVDNFEHQRFSVMLYHHKLPLYITFVYHTVLYASLHFARRLGLDALPEALVCGLFAVLMYSPYDLIGPQMPWWVWKDHLTTETRWLGVPYSSTLWMLLFHAVLCWLVARRDRKQGDESASVPRFSFQVVMVALGTLGLGFITFLPYHGLRFAGLSDATILIAFLVLACSIVALDQPQFRGSKDKDILAISVLWHGFFLGALVMARPSTAIVISAGAMLLLGVFLHLVCARFNPSTDE
jgi:hypothetical protein